MSVYAALFGTGCRLGRCTGIHGGGRWMMYGDWCLIGEFEQSNLKREV
jgi:hypothetical protein